MKRNEQTRKLTVEKLEAPIDNSWEIGDSEHEVPDSTTCSKRVVVTTTSAVHVPDSTTGVKSTTEHRLSQALICDSDSTDGSDIVVTVNNSTKPRDEIFGETGSMYNPSECAAPIMSDSVAPRDAARVSSSKFYRTSSAYPGTMEESVLADRVPKHGGQEEDGVGLRHPHHQMKAHDGSLPQSGGDYAEREKIDDKTPQETSTKHVLNAKKHTME
ncbi:unnamed protein product [Heligmosomoides polygyrus]|uniref:Uncharacterized protein n=1 Tax=Heligmosomoides polygyrus TaxID=6339 RepID=A0A183GSE8_HELPZ|nr:unnamed protein product [Heligmosomoides polygyrus]